MRIYPLHGVARDKTKLDLRKFIVENRFHPRLKIVSFRRFGDDELAKPDRGADSVI